MIPSGNERSAPLQHPIAPSGSHSIHTGSWLFCRADEIADALLQPTTAAREQAAENPVSSSVLLEDSQAWCAWPPILAEPSGEHSPCSLEVCPPVSRHRRRSRSRYRRRSRSRNREEQETIHGPITRRFD